MPNTPQPVLPAPETNSFNFQSVLFGPFQSLSLNVVSVNSTNGAVTINGGDTRQPGTPFSWQWGDGSTTSGFFPQSHTYSSVNLQLRGNGDCFLQWRLDWNRSNDCVVRDSDYPSRCTAIGYKRHHSNFTTGARKQTNWLWVLASIDEFHFNEFWNNTTDNHPICANSSSGYGARF